MEHILNRLEVVRESDLMRPSSRYYHQYCDEILPLELKQKGCSLVSIVEIDGGGPVVLRDINDRIIAYWDTYPSLTDLSELVSKLNQI